MFSGNHALVHSLDTILRVAYELRYDNDFLFVFIGGGVRKKDVTNFKHKNNLNNIIQLPFQSRNNFHISLSAADIQLVIMGQNLVGYTHPNKIYGALYVGRPIIYIGPENSHVTDILGNLDGNLIVNHNDTDSIIRFLLNFKLSEKNLIEKIGNRNYSYCIENFNSNLILNKINSFIIK